MLSRLPNVYVTPSTNLRRLCPSLAKCVRRNSKFARPDQWGLSKYSRLPPSIQENALSDADTVGMFTCVLLRQVRHSKLCLAKRVELVCVCPVRRKEDARSEESTLKMALDRNSAYLRKREITK